MSELADLQKMVNELKNTSSSNDKKEILSRYPECKKILYYTYNSFKQYYCSSENVLKSWASAQIAKGPNLFGSAQSLRSASDHPNAANTPKNYYADLYQLLDALDDRKITGQKAISEIVSFISRKDNIAYKNLILDILDRDLKCRISSSIVNKVWPKLIPEFNTALANSYWDNEDKVDFAKDVWYASRKLDGCVSGDTLVAIEDKGVLPIREVVENKIQGKVKSYNHKTKKIEYCEIEGWSKNGNLQDPENDSLWYEIETENGQKIKVTGNHLIYLPKLNVYRRADELVEGDTVLQE
jgi:hypothetical protein